MPAVEYRVAVRLAKKASLGGAKRRSTTVWEWDIAGNCQSPKVNEVWSRPSADHPHVARRENAKRRQAFAIRGAKRILGGGPSMYSWEKPPARVGMSKYLHVRQNGDNGVIVVEMTVRCRKCPACLKMRSRMWYARAMTETLASARTWFGTITLNPEAQFLSIARARRNATRRGLVWEQMTPQEQFAHIHRANGAELTLWIKRVRKQSGAPLRYLLVCEAHKSGLPHYHCLVHETDDAAPVRHHVLSDQWKLGFTNFKLCTDAKQAGYLCKYLSKSAEARVRASARYGENALQAQCLKNTSGLPTVGRQASHDTPGVLRRPEGAQPNEMGAISEERKWVTQ